MQSSFKITQKQIDEIRPFMPNIDDYLKGSLADFQDELNLAIIGELDEEYEDTPNSYMLQKLYDEIFLQNK